MQSLLPSFSRNQEITIPIFCAGAFSFYTTFKPLPDFSVRPVPTPQPTRTPDYYIDVCPRLTINGELLPLDSLSIFSLISKLMGKYPQDWAPRLEGIGRRLYNMIHFTPLMRRGHSNSPYSIYDQLEFDRVCFPNGEADVADLTSCMEQEYGLLGLTDVVWNHTANNSAWLQDHPEAGYNLQTAPWLQSAFELDTALLKFSGELKTLGLPTTLRTVEDLQLVVNTIKPEVITRLRLWEYYVVDVKRESHLILDAWVSGQASIPPDGFGDCGIGGLDVVKDWPLRRKATFLRDKALLGDDRMGERFRRKTDPSVGAALVTAMFGRYEEADMDKDRKDAVLAAITAVLDELNLPFYKEYDADSAMILKQIFDRVKYVRLDENGPKCGPITLKRPLIETYFTRLPLNQRTQKHDQGSLALVNNGWIWGADAMVDHAGYTSKAYLRRQVIVWGDCVKLRYGSSPKDSPFLWEHMARYTRLMAKHFTGFRIDNCHSTPIYVAEYLLDEARKVRPNLYVCAELFTGSEEMDYIFVKRLGISSLIREAMQAWGTGELSRLVHMHAGRPIGSFDIDRTPGLDSFTPLGDMRNDVHGGEKGGEVHRIRKTPVHALFADCTHDNQVPAQKRDARDTISNAALVYMCACATGSVMGYDEIYPKTVDLVHETRLYGLPESGKGGTDGPGILPVKSLLNKIHTRMGMEGYDETYIHHEGEYITVHRVHPRTRKGYFLIAHTAFPGYDNGHAGITPVRMVGTKAQQVGSWSLEVDVSEEARSTVLNDQANLRGLPSKLIPLKSAVASTEGDTTIITVNEPFPPGSVALFETWMPNVEQDAGLDVFLTTGAQEALDGLNLTDLNFILYRCEPEERDSSFGKDGVYNVPNYGPLVYAGLQGWWSVLKNIIKTNDLGHALCKHLRSGCWALDYIVGRLERISREWQNDSLKKLTVWFKERFDAVKKVPSSLIPRYFALVLQTAYSACWHRSLGLMSEEVRHSQRFAQSLAMVSVQQTGLMRSASLYSDKSVPSLAAGLPHFASDWARCWGRDIFISLRGLYLCTGRFEDAKNHILAFASVLKHGMIPNLLNSGRAPRYNSRDSIWFYLQCLQDYTMMTSNGDSILRDTVARRFLPYDDTWFPHDDPRAYSKTSAIEDVIQEAMQRHASGLSFREANAGPGLDMQMKPEGFQIDIMVDWQTGFILGGSQSNCGTWQDKMGESEKAGSRGVPGTPRDGAAVEIVGLCYSTLVWLNELNAKGLYRYEGVKLESDGGAFMSFREWASKIKDNFERCFFVPLDEADDSVYDINSRLVNRRGVYKDLYRSGKEHEDYQLRANFPIAMCCAPDLFDPERALHALHLVDSILRGPLGMATLDPTDQDYRPYYNNSEDSADFATAKGRNYHQGPEWLWPTGFFLRALLKFDLMRRKTKEERTESFQQITRRLKGCKETIEESPWAGLPELTNKNGNFCADSVSNPPLPFYLCDAI